jgi:digeranylgeranylglycerophospholipid reductase
MEKADVVIVGGGMAGLSTAASLCAESDLRVVLVEKKAIGSNQSIRAVFKKAIEEFGLEASVLQRYTGFIFHSPLGAIARYDYKNTELMGIDYEHGCRLLHERAFRSGLKDIPAQAIDWSPKSPDSKKPLTVQLDNGESIQTEILVDASGASQWAAKHLQIKLSPLFSICYGEYFRGCHMDDDQYFRFLAPNRNYGNGGGWMYPSGDGKISFGYSVVVSHPHIENTSLVSGYMSAKHEFHPYAEWVAQGVRERMEGGVVPVGRIGQFVADRILIVGDAAGQAHPWSVEGCRPSLYNGKLAAKVIMRAFDGKCFDRKALSAYEREWSKSNRERFWRSKSVADITWRRSDKEWDQFIAATTDQPPEVQMKILQDNPATRFQKVYAVGGYFRRQALKWCKKRIGRYVQEDSI